MPAPRSSLTTLRWLLLFVWGCAESETSPVRETRHGLPLGTIDEVGIDSSAFVAFLAEAERTRSNALIVIKDDLLVYESYFGGDRHAIRSMSASKSFVSLAVGYLVSEGRLALDQRGADFLPGWSRDPVKSRVTIRHLLTHTSGLSYMRAFSRETGDLLPLESWLEETPAEAEPDRVWAYNNGAVDALALIAERAAGETLDTYLGSHLFDPIGAARGEWARFPDGAPMAAGEFTVDPIALAKVGRLLVRGGIGDDGRRVIPEGWIDASLTPTALQPAYGRLWWRNVEVEAVGLNRPTIEYWASHGIPSGVIQALDPIVGRPFASFEEAVDGVRAVLSPAQLREVVEVLEANGGLFPFLVPLSVGAMRGYVAFGSLGQFLFVYPERELVVVRMNDFADDDVQTLDDVPRQEFLELPRMALTLVGERPGAGANPLVVLGTAGRFLPRLRGDAPGAQD